MINRGLFYFGRLSGSRSSGVKDVLLSCTRPNILTKKPRNIFLVDFIMEMLKCFLESVSQCRL